MPSHTLSRSSSPKSPSSHRPKLTRSSATAPSLATSTASRKDLASLQSSSRAAAYLTRVASYSSAQRECEREQRSPRSVESGCSSGQGSPAGRKVEMGIQQSGNYFCFPSFEDFEEYHEEMRRCEGGVD